MLEINYCHSGRIGWQLTNGNFVYLGPGDFSLHTMKTCVSSVMTLPNGDYEELSKQYLINTTTLKNVFKAVYGTSIASHVKTHRLEKAAELLKNTQESIADIAAQVGYDSQSKFSSSFKEQYHVLPSEYRKKP